MAYLLDTCVISELKKKSSNRGVVNWMTATARQTTYLNVVTLGEIRRGIELLRLKNTVAAESLEHWLSVIETSFDSRILPITPAIADRWGRLSLHQPLPVIDGLLAATALEHRLSVVTRNVADFQRSGVNTTNPFQ